MASLFSHHISTCATCTGASEEKMAVISVSKSLYCGLMNSSLGNVNQNIGVSNIISLEEHFKEELEGNWCGGPVDLCRAYGRQCGRKHIDTFAKKE